MKKPLNRKVVIVGFEIATALGYGLEKTWQRAVNGESGINWVSRVDVGNYHSQAVGEIPDLDFSQYDFITDRELKNWFSSFIPLSMILSYDALKNSKIQITEEERYRTGIILGHALDGLDGYEENLNKLANGSTNSVSPYLLPNICNNLSCGKVSILLNLKGPQYSIGSACASGNHCIAEAARSIQCGFSDIMLAGGVELPILEPIIYGFGNMNTLIKRKEKDRAYNAPEKSSRPYSIDRNGFVLSEGGAVLVLTSLDYALENNLDIYAEILGVGMTGDAYHYTAPSLDSVAKCIEFAIQDANLDKSEIEYINGHGTSTKKGDHIEVNAVKSVFGKQKLLMSSNKSQIGHSLGATAAIEAVLTVYGMRKQTILPTINYIGDPNLNDINFVANESLHQDYSIALSNSFGFGGTNCCIVFKKYQG